MIGNSYYDAKMGAFCVENNDKEKIKKLYEYFRKIVENNYRDAQGEEFYFIKDIKIDKVDKHTHRVCIFHRPYEEYLAETIHEKISDYGTLYYGEIKDDKLLITEDYEFVKKKKSIDEETIKKYVSSGNYEFISKGLATYIHNETFKKLSEDLNKLKEKIVDAIG